ncbi:MAG: DUF6677 family protein [Planctomycetota bacterium]|jgi:hypothetical protein
MALGSGLHPVVRVPVAGLLAWIVPGLGHLFIGERARGLIYLIAITVTFWGGIAIGGVRDTVNPRARTAWFMAQTCTGVNCLVAYNWGEQIRRDPEAPVSTRAHHRSADTAVVYTGIAGLLNLLAILDALVRADAVSARPRPNVATHLRKGAT